MVVTDDLTSVLDTIAGLPLDAETIGVGGGDVSGPASSTDNAVVRWSGTAGNLVQDSTAILLDTGELSTESEGTTTTALSVVGDALTSGALMALTSASGSATARTLASVVNTGSATNTTILALTQNGAGAAALSIAGRASIDSPETTGIALRVTGDDITTGKVARFESSADGSGTRTLVEIDNTHVDAVNTTVLSLTNTSTGRSLSVSGAADTGSVAQVQANSLTTGSALLVASNSADTGTRSVLRVLNDSASATGAVALLVTQDSTATASRVVHNANGTAIDVQAAGLTTGSAVVVSDTNATATTGGLLLLTSNSDSDGSRSLLRVENLHEDSSAAIAVDINQDSFATALSISSRGRAIDITSDTLSTPAISVQADTLQTAGIMHLLSSSSDVGTRSLLHVEQADGAATGTTALQVSQVADQNAIYVAAGNTSTTAVVIQADALLGGGGGLRVESNSTDSDARSLVALVNNNVLASDTTVLTIEQEGDQVALDLAGAAGGSIQFQEIADHPGGAPGLGKGKLWVRSDEPNVLVFTNDAGTDTVLGAGGGSGDVVGPASATDNALVRFDGTTGKLIQNSTAILADAGTLALTSTSATGYALSMTANSATTGGLILATSSSADATERALISIQNTNAASVGTAALDILQSSSGQAVNINTASAGNTAVNLIANSLTTGTAMRIQSASSSASVRTMLDIVSSDAAAIDTTILKLTQGSDGPVVVVETSSLDHHVFEVTANTLTTGDGLRISSSSASTSARSIIRAVNANSLATGTAVVTLDQASVQPSIELLTEASIRFAEIDEVPQAPGIARGTIWVRDDTPNVLVFTNDEGTDTVLSGVGGGDVVGPASSTDNAIVRFDGTTGKLIQNSTAIVADSGAISVTSTGDTGDAASIVADSLTTGRGLLVSSNSSSTGSRSLLRVLNDHADSANTVALSIQQDATQLSIDMDGTAAIRWQERTAVPIGNVAGKGILWIRNDTPNVLVFTNDEGTNTVLGAGGGSGDVVGPASATDNAIARFDSTTGKLVQNSSATVSDAGELALTSTGTTTTALTVTASSLTTGRVLAVLSSSGDTGTRELLQVNNTHASAVNTTAFTITQSADAPSSRFDNPGVLTKTVMAINASALTTGSALFINSAATNDTARYLATVQNEDSGATGAINLRLNQNAANVALELTGPGGASGGGGIKMQAIDNDVGTTGSGKGIFWVKTGTPTVAFFTDSAGTDFSLIAQGDVVGPASATDNAIARFDSTTGKLLQNSSAVVSDAGELAITSTGTTTYAVNVTADSVTDGGALIAASNSANTNARALIALQNLNAAATGTVALDIIQNSTGSALFINTGSAANPAVRVIANDLTTGQALYVSSSSDSPSTRNLVAFENTDVGAAATTCLRLVQDAAGRGLYLTSASLTSNAAEIETTALSSGNALSVTSSSTSTSARAVVNAENSGAAAASCPVFRATQASTAPAIELLSNASIRFSEIAAVPAAPGDGKGTVWVRNSAPSVLVFTNDEGTDTVLSGVGGGDVSGPASSTDNAVTRFDGTSGKTIQNSAAILNDITATTADVFAVDGADSLTTGSVALFRSNSSDTGERAVVMITNDNTAAVNAAGLAVKQDADENAIDLQGAGSAIRFMESAAAPGGAPGAGRGKYWVEDEAPNVPMFTNDAGTDFILNNIGAQLYVTGLSQAFTSTTPTKITGTSTLSEYGGLFDNGGANDITIRYIGATTRNVKFYWTVGVREDPASGSVGCFICQLYKNGSLVTGSDSRAIAFAAAGSTASGEFFASAALNDEFELYGFRLDALANVATQNVIFNAELL